MTVAAPTGLLTLNRLARASLGQILRLSIAYVNVAGQVVRTDNYYNVANLDYVEEPYLGVANTPNSSGTDLNANYYSTFLVYDSSGRVWQTRTPNGTLYYTIYDPLGRVIGNYVDAISGNTMLLYVQVSSNQYDNGGVGDGNLTQSVQYPQGTTNGTQQVTQFWYNWRDRQVAVKVVVQSVADETNS